VGDRVAHWQVESTLPYGQLVKRRERQKVVFTSMRMAWEHALIWPSRTPRTVFRTAFKRLLLSGSI